MPSSSERALPDLTGKVLSNGYRLLSSLGSGTWGTVYKAVDPDYSPGAMPAYYAVKCMRLSRKTAFEGDIHDREVRHHQAVTDHPNVVAYRGVLFDTDYVYIILDLCSGGDLFNLIVRDEFFVKRTDRIKTAFLQIIDAVEHCHKRGIFHRDLKPENVLCSVDGLRVFIADFGLSTSSPWSSDYRCGSWEYMSPDCIAQEFGFSHRMYSTRQNDLWALGVILVNLVTKRSPWKTASKSDACFNAFIKDKNYFLRVLPISVEVNNILKRVFSLDPRQRMPLHELRKQIIALESFFPPGFDEIVGTIQPIHADEISPRNTACIQRSPSNTLAAPLLSLGISGSGFCFGQSLITRISDFGTLAKSLTRSVSLASVLHNDRVRRGGPPESIRAEDIPNVDSDSSSAADSDEPITPETYAIVVEEDIDEVLLLDEPEPDAIEEVKKASRFKIGWMRHSKLLKRFVNRGAEGGPSLPVLVQA